MTLGLRETSGRQQNSVVALLCGDMTRTAVLLVATLGMTACGGGSDGVSQSDVDLLREELDALETDYEVLLGENEELAEQLKIATATTTTTTIPPAATTTTTTIPPAAATTTTTSTTPTTTLPAISLDEVVFVLYAPFSNYLRTLPSERSSEEVLAALQTLPLDQPIAGAEEIELAPPAELLGDDVPLHVFLTQLIGVADGSIRGLGLDYRIKDLVEDVPTMGPALITRRSNTVGSDVSPGTYVTFDVDGCYWETLDNTGEINNNNFVSSAPRVEVTIRESDFAFNSHGCGGSGSYTEDWVQLE